MSYTPTEWKTGDVITADKLNNMESGIVVGQELFIIHATGITTQPNTPTTPVLDKTYNEISSAIQQGKIPVIIAEVTLNGVSGFMRIPYTYIMGEPANAIVFTMTSYVEAKLTGVTVFVTQNACQSVTIMATIQMDSGD